MYAFVNGVDQDQAAYQKPPDHDQHCFFKQSVDSTNLEYQTNFLFQIKMRKNVNCYFVQQDKAKATGTNKCVAFSTKFDTISYYMGQTMKCTSLLPHLS